MALKVMELAWSWIFEILLAQYPLKLNIHWTMIDDLSIKISQEYMVSFLRWYIYFCSLITSSDTSLFISLVFVKMDFGYITCTYWISMKRTNCHIKFEITSFTHDNSKQASWKDKTWFGCFWRWYMQNADDSAGFNYDCIISQLPW